MFSTLSFAVLVIGAIEKNDFEIRHSIQLGYSEDATGINVNEVTIEVKDELTELICTEYDEMVEKCEIEGTVELKVDVIL